VTKNDLPDRKAGDKVLIDGAQIATILSYNVEANLLSYETGLAGGGSNTVYAHISNTRIEDLPGDVGVLADSVDSKKLAKAQEKQDDINEAHRANHVDLADEVAASDANLAAEGKAPLKGQTAEPAVKTPEPGSNTRDLFQ